MSIVEEPGICYCECHENTDIMHVVACCYICEGCGRDRIRDTSLHDCPGEKHEDVVSEVYDEVVELVHGLTTERACEYGLDGDRLLEDVWAVLKGKR